MLHQLSPKLVAANRRAAENDARERALHDAAMREIADIEAREKRIKRETLTCYQEYAPVQVMRANGMIEAHEMARALDKAQRLSKGGVPVWDRVGKSRGGKRKGNLYRCNMALVSQVSA
jgi:hypothetical protein